MNEIFAAICFSVMKELGIDLESFQNKTPRNFWGKVVAELDKENQLTERGDKWNSKNASQYWGRNKDIIAAWIELEFKQARRRLEKERNKAEVSGAVDIEEVLQDNTEAGELQSVPLETQEVIIADSLNVTQDNVAKEVLQVNTDETQIGDPEIINELPIVTLSNTSETHVTETQAPILDVTQYNTDVTPQDELQSVTSKTHVENVTDTDVTQETTAITHHELPRDNTCVTQDEFPKHSKTLCVTEELIEEMKAIARAVYQEMNHSEIQSVTDIRPVFKRGETDARSVRLDKRMMQAAIEKSQVERVKTGGTLNGLIEVLIWEYLGKPEEFIEG